MVLQKELVQTRKDFGLSDHDYKNKGTAKGTAKGTVKINVDNVM